VLSLAAGTVLGADPLKTIRVAACAGFGAAGLRLDLVVPTPGLVQSIRSALSETDLMLLDVEVLWLRPDEPDDEQPIRLVDLAAELGARHVLVVSQEPSKERAADRVRRLCERAEASRTNLRVALEFPGYSTVRSLAEAVEVVTRAAHPLGAVLVDSLHLTRTGGRPDDLALVPEGLLPYIQVCDSASAAACRDARAYMAEARGGRLLPGQGCLPVAALVNAFLARPEAMGISVEVLSLDLARRHSPADRARMAFASVAPLLEGSSLA
jgi:sugar phosphate isomerase/epimerase